MHDLTLDVAPPDAQLAVIGLTSESPAARRLKALGFRIGAHVTIIGRAPFGDPLLVALDDTRIALRANEAALVMVAIDKPSNTGATR